MTVCYLVTPKYELHDAPRYNSMEQTTKETWGNKIKWFRTVLRIWQGLLAIPATSINTLDEKDDNKIEKKPITYLNVVKYFLYTELLELATETLFMNLLWTNILCSTIWLVKVVSSVHSWKIQNKFFLLKQSKKKFHSWIINLMTTRAEKKFLVCEKNIFSI